jgi:hypothetical protein
MKFVCVEDVGDMLRKGSSYQGGFIWGGKLGGVGLRIVVFTDRGGWMTFDPAAFRNGEGE